MVLKKGTIISEDNILVTVKSEGRLFDIKKSNLVGRFDKEVEFDDKNIELKGNWRWKIKRDHPNSSNEGD
jgi:hypothetical protein